MRKLQSLVAGWINTSIRDVTDTGLLSRFGSVLITSIDSTTDLSSVTMKNRLAEVDPNCVLLGSGVMVQGESLVTFAKNMDLFTGFDELWCFERPPSTPRPNDLWIVSPLNLETDSVPPHLASWMDETDCKLGLGDGIVLNYATPLEELASMLVRLAARS